MESNADRSTTRLDYQQPPSQACLGELVFHPSPQERRASLKTPAWEARLPAAVRENEPALIPRPDPGDGGNGDKSTMCFQNFPRTPCAHAEKLTGATLRAKFLQIQKISHITNTTKKRWSLPV